MAPILYCADQAAQSLYRVEALPAYVVIDPEGTIVAREHSWSAVRAVLDERLERLERLDRVDRRE